MNPTLTPKAIALLRQAEIRAMSPEDAALAKKYPRPTLEEARMSRVKVSVLVGLLALLLVLPGSVELAEDQPTPTPIPTPAESNKPIHDVKKGSIVQTVKSSFGSRLSARYGP